MQSLRYYIPGATLVMAAILIVVVPEILLAMIAGIFLIAGAGTLALGHVVRKTNDQMEWGDTWFNHGYTTHSYFSCSPFNRQFKR